MTFRPENCADVVSVFAELKKLKVHPGIETETQLERSRDMIS